MGTRADDLIDDEQAHASFRRLLARAGEPAPLSPPPDLVARTARRLPKVPPAVAYRQELARRIVRGLLLATLLLAALGGALLVLGDRQAIALFGDSTRGLGRAILTFQLLLKPIVGTFGAVGLQFLLSGALSAAGAALLFRRLSRAIVGAGAATYSGGQ